jgi:hypothetical protein
MISIWVSNKTNEVLLFHEKTQEIETDYSRFFCSKIYLKVFDVGWTRIGYV